MAEAQKIRDKEMRGIRSSNHYSNRVNKDRIDKIKRAEDIIQDLERHGPAGLIHISILSNIIGKPIQIWNANGNLNRIIGKRKTGRPIDVEYHETDSERIGHWTLKCGKDPDNISIDLNSCLFSVIGSQIGRNPSQLRKLTVLKLKSNLRRLASRIDEILRLEKNGKIVLMIGGACYCGNTPNDAMLILENSQGAFSLPVPSEPVTLQLATYDPMTVQLVTYDPVILQPVIYQPMLRPQVQGHPRDHARHSLPPNIQTSSNRQPPWWKTGFLSRTDQNYVTHLALSTYRAQMAMDALNGGNAISITCYEQVIRVPPREMARNLPKAIEYERGRQGVERDIMDVILILRHQAGQFYNPNADVFVQTCYPTL